MHLALMVRQSPFCELKMPARRERERAGRLDCGLVPSDSCEVDCPLLPRESKRLAEVQLLVAHACLAQPAGLALLLSV